MIVHEHPGIEILDRSPFPFYLIGSRAIGHFKKTSDYDFLVSVDSNLYGHDGLYQWMKDAGFEGVENTHYDDPNLLTDEIYRKEFEDFPSIDLLPVTPAEAVRRMRFFDGLRSMHQNEAACFCSHMKARRAWGRLWKALELSEASR